MRRIALCLFCVVGLTGCITALPPEVEVVGAEVAEQSDQGARVEVALVISNPNDVAIPLPQTSYTVNVEDAGSYSYVEIPASVLGPKGVQAIRLPAAVATDGRDVNGQRWDISGSVTYDPKNFLRAFLTQSGVPLPIVLFSGDGVLE